MTRALGADPDVKPDYWVRPIRPGERYLLCSDGLSGEVDDPTLASILASGLPPDEAAATLVGLALEAGGRDNVTAVIVDVVSVPAFDDASTDRNSQKLPALRELALRRTADRVDADMLTYRRSAAVSKGEEIAPSTRKRPSHILAP